jgi:hypothetical protein
VQRSEALNIHGPGVLTLGELTLMREAALAGAGLAYMREAWIALRHLPRSRRPHVSRRESTDRRLTQLVNDFFSVNANIGRRRNAQSHLVSTYLKDGNRDVRRDAH